MKKLVELLKKIETMRLKNKIAIITGSSGFGKGIAKNFLMKEQN